MSAHSPHTILFVDDEKSILKALNRLFFDEDYRIITAESGRDALDLLHAGEKPTVIISDQRMPGMTGAEFLAQAKKILPDSIRMVLTGYADINAAVDAVNLGEVYRYIMKPWNDDDLKLTIKEAISRFDLVEENRQLSRDLEERKRELYELNAALEQKVEERTAELQKLVRELKGRDQIQQYLQQIHPLDELLHTILPIIVKAAGIDAAAYYQINEDNSCHSPAGAGFAQNVPEETKKNIEEAVRHAVATGDTTRPAADDSGFLAVIPVARREKIFGALVIHKRGEQIDETELHTCEGFAGQAAIGIDDCRLQENFVAIESSLDDVLSTL